MVWAEIFRLLADSRRASIFLKDTREDFFRRVTGAHSSSIRFKHLRGRHFLRLLEDALTHRFIGLRRRLRSGSLKIYEPVAKAQNSSLNGERSTRNQALTPAEGAPSVSSHRL
jgi:hypothetical protein